MMNAPAKVLLVEANIGDAALLRTALSEVSTADFACQLVHTDSLSAALSALAGGAFDLVLLDLSLPDAHGMDTVVQVREMAPALPLVIMTGVDDEALAVEAMRNGAQDYLVKGQVEGKLLLRTIRYATERKRMAAQLQLERQRQAVLHDINLSVTSTLDVASVLDTLVDKIARTYPDVATSVRLLNRQTGNWERLACRNLDEADWKKVVYAGGSHLIHAVVEAKMPVVIADVQNDPRAAAPGFLRRHGFVSYLGVPLIVHGELLGVLSFYGREKGQFGDREIEFLSTLAGEAAIAIYYSQLYEKIKIAHEQAITLRQIDLAMTSTMDLRGRIDVLLDQILQCFPRWAITLRLLNKATGEFEPLACRNLDEQEWKNTAPKIGAGGLHEVVKARKPLAISDVQNDPRARYRDFLRHQGLVSFLGVPLIFQDEILGVLGLFTREKHEFNLSEVEFLSTLAGQAATAIHNSRLFEQVVTRTDELAALYDVTVSASESLNLKAIVDTVIKKISDIFRFDATRIFLFDAHGEELNLEAAYSKLSSSLAAVGSFRRGQGIAGIVADTGNAIVISDVQTDYRYQELSYTKLTSKAGHHFVAGFPIKHKDKTLGVMMCIDQNPRELTNDEIRLLTSMTNQIGVAVENSQLYERIKTSNDTLEKALEVKSMLMGVMAHELKNPIQFIMGAAGLLAEGASGALTEEQQRRVKAIEASANELRELIDGALDMARLERGKILLAVTEIRVSSLLAELKSEFETAFQQKGVELTMIFPPPDFIMKNDRIKLKEILRNLIDNARKFTPKGRVAVEFAQQDNGRVEFTVRDTGIGIKKELLPKVFELFYQVDAFEKEHAGAGLGLNIVKRLVELLAGEIDVASEVGKGTTFRVSFPKELSPAQPL